MKLLLMLVAMCVFSDDGMGGPDTLVICPPDFRQALQPWVEYRKQQGYKVVVQTPSSTCNGIADQIQSQSQASPLKNVVLIGDAADDNVPRRRLVPTGFVAAKVNVKFGSEFEIATDHAYADLNNDGNLDLNIGRIPVDTASQLSTYIDRIIQYESQQNLDDWNRRVSFVAGVGGFGQMLDKMIEQSVKKIVTDLIPPEFDTTMAYGSWRSPYCPDPRRFSQTVVSKYNEGCLFWIYVGHGDRRRLDRIKVPNRQFDILDNRSVVNIRAKAGPPIAVFLSCYTAATDAAYDGLGERMINQPGGPAAVISSSRVSMPYAMSIFSLEMLDQYFRGETETLGELIRLSKQGMVQFDPRKSEYHQLIESLGKAFSPEPGLLDEERREHVHLMHLLGDPLLKLNRPGKLRLTAPANVIAGDSITVSGTAKQAGNLNLDVCYRRDRFRVRPPRRRAFDPTDESLSKFQDIYEQAQDLVCTRKTIRVSKGHFSFDLTVPDNCSGECFVRGQLTADGYMALGATSLFVRSLKSSSEQNSQPNVIRR